MADSETPEKKGALWWSVRVGFVLAMVVYLLNVNSVLLSFSLDAYLFIVSVFTPLLTIFNVVIAFLQAKKNPQDKFARYWRWISLLFLMILILLAFSLTSLSFNDGYDLFSEPSAPKKILDDFRTGDKKFSLSISQVDINSGDGQLLAMGVKNTNPQNLGFRVIFAEIGKDPNGSTGAIATPIESDVAVEGRPFDILWDSTPQVLGPGDGIVIPFTLKAGRTATGTKLLKITIIELDDFGQDKMNLTTNLPSEYASETFFVRFGS